MFKEKKKILDTNIIFYKLLNFLSEPDTKGYEIGNIVDDDGDWINAANSEELVKDEGQVFISINVIKELFNLILDQKNQRVGSSLNNKNGN